MTPPTSSFTENEEKSQDDDVYRITRNGIEYIIVGTAHISSESADLVSKVITDERPDCVCVELDERRLKSLVNQDHWQNLDLKEVIRTKQLSTLFLQILLTSFQKRLGKQTGVIPGTEMLAAIDLAKSENIQVELCDRDVSITLKRVWKSTPFTKKALLVSSLFTSLFDQTKVSEEDLKEIRRQDVLTEMLNELSKTFPTFKSVLIDERDEYFAIRLKQVRANRIVAVVGAGHVKGIISSLHRKDSPILEDLEQVPSAKPLAKWIGWAIPLAILGALIWIGFTKGGEVAGRNAIYWGLANGIPSALGSLLAFGHPFTIVSAFVSAPFTSLSPLVGAGYISAFVQAWVLPPRVHEIQNVGDEIREFRRWWGNRFLRIFLVFFLTGMGSILGTWIGGIKIFQNLF